MEETSGLMNAPMPSDPALVPYIGGILRIEGVSSIERREAEREAAEEANNRPYVQGLAAYVKSCWEQAYRAKITSGVEERMLKSLRQRRGEYDPEVLTEIRKTGGSEIYMMLTSNKCRAAASWLRDVLLGSSNEKPWTISPTPIPDLPPVMMQSVQRIAQAEAQAYQQTTGSTLGPQDMERVLTYVRDRVLANVKKQAAEACRRMELKMEDQLAEGGFYKALSEFIEDIVTFPSAFIEGPIVKNKRALKWVPRPDGDFEPLVQDELRLEWERIDPFMVYPMPHCTNVDDGGLFVRRKLSRQALNEMKGVEGYSDAAIDAVLEEFGRGGLHEWLAIDTKKATAEGKSPVAMQSSQDSTIDALQYRGSVMGSMLIEWGMDESTIPDPTKEYSCEVWLIGNWVIKAVLNSDPLGRKNIYKASYEEIPGVFWGNSVADLCRDVQSQCNTAARAIANNMAIGSGPQVVYNVDRLPSGEDLTALYPMKIWMTTSDPFGSNSRAVDFFTVPMVSGELMQIYAFFSALADEHTGIPRFMYGDPTGSGALRTSSGLSMLMNNASKGIKQVVMNIDVGVVAPLIERLWFYNMKYGTDPELKGDIKVIARGAASLIVKETRQQRINEFLQLALTNPVVNQIVGEEAIAALLRTAARNLDMDVDNIVPPPEVIRARVFQLQQQQAQMMQAQQQFQMALATAPSHEVELQRGPEGEVLGMVVKDKTPHVLPTPATPVGMTPAQAPQGPATVSNPNQYTNGEPIVDMFSPMRRA